MTDLLIKTHDSSAHKQIFDYQLCTQTKGFSIRKPRDKNPSVMFHSKSFRHTTAVHNKSLTEQE